MPVMELNHSFSSTVKSLLEIVEIFMSLIKGFNKPGTWIPTETAVKANIEFIERYTDWKIRTRENVPIYDKINKDDINSGDSFLIIRMDGLDPFIATTTGTRVGHTTVALRDPQTKALNICESQWAD